LNVLIINAHLTDPGWFEGQLNLAFMDAAKAFFAERGHQVTGTHVERGYRAEAEVENHAAAHLGILQTPVNWFGAPWIYEKYVDDVFNAGMAKKVLLEGDGRARQDPTRQYGSGGKMQGRKFTLSASGMPRARLSATPRRAPGRQGEGRPVSSDHLQLQILRLRHSPGFRGL
jgi:modulator of drug activity B